MLLGYANGAAVNVGKLRNNLAFMGTALANGTGAGVDEQSNSWDTALGLTVSATDFESTATTEADVVLYDYMQEVSRLPGAFTLAPAPSPPTIAVEVSGFITAPMREQAR